MPLLILIFRRWAEAEDVVMESMIALWENRDRWEENKGLHALLLTIIKNKALHVMSTSRCDGRKKPSVAANEDNLAPQTRIGLTYLHVESLRTRQDFQYRDTAYRKQDLAGNAEQSRRIFMLSRYQNLANKDATEHIT